MGPMQHRGWDGQVLGVANAERDFGPHWKCSDAVDHKGKMTWQTTSTTTRSRGGKLLTNARAWEAILHRGRMGSRIPMLVGAVRTGQRWGSQMRKLRFSHTARRAWTRIGASTYRDHNLKLAAEKGGLDGVLHIAGAHSEFCSKCHQAKGRLIRGQRGIMTRGFTQKQKAAWSQGSLDENVIAVTKIWRWNRVEDTDMNPPRLARASPWLFPR